MKPISKRGSWTTGGRKVRRFFKTTRRRADRRLLDEQARTAVAEDRRRSIDRPDQRADDR